MTFGDGKVRVPKDSKVLSNMVEALLGAVYMDGGFRVATRVIRRLFSPYFELERLEKKNPKNELQEYSQKKWALSPSTASHARQKTGSVSTCMWARSTRPGGSVRASVRLSDTQPMRCSRRSRAVHDHACLPAAPGVQAAMHLL